MKSYLKSKTFWAGILIVIIEILSALKEFPLPPEYAQILPGLLAVFIAINRALKNIK